MLNLPLTTEQKIDEIHNEVVKNDNMLDALNFISIALGFYNSYLNIQQIDNNSIMAELNKQDKIYFEIAGAIAQLFKN